MPHWSSPVIFCKRNQFYMLMALFSSWLLLKTCQMQEKIVLCAVMLFSCQLYFWKKAELIFPNHLLQEKPVLCAFDTIFYLVTFESVTNWSSSVVFHKRNQYLVHVTQFSFKLLFESLTNWSSAIIFCRRSQFFVLLTLFFFFLGYFWKHEKLILSS